MARQQQSFFQKALLASSLVSQDQLNEALETLRPTDSGGKTSVAESVKDDRLAEKLVADNVLTAYQATQLKAGRTKLTLGPYVILDFIAQGGMGQVFKAEHRLMGRQVAIKVLPHAKSTPEAIENFTREIRTQARLDHPNLVRAHDAGHDGNVYFLVTEFVPGTDLRRLVRTQGKLSMQQAASILTQAAEGLGHAHREGLIHRDVKPGNILVTPEGVAKVSDLGLAGSTIQTTDSPRAGKIVGTADYLSPEQIVTPRDITAASDIYSLGCTLYYAVTGKVPFPGGSPSDKARRHCKETPWHPRRFNPELEEEFVEIVADMMEKDRDARVASADDVVARLEPWASEEGPPPSQKLTRSPWTPPPLPTGEEQDDELDDTDPSGLPGFESGSSQQVSQISQGTKAVGAADDDTSTGSSRRLPTPPPMPVPQPPPVIASRLPFPLSRDVLIALVCTIPPAMALGALLTLLLIWLF